MADISITNAVPGVPSYPVDPFVPSENAAPVQKNIEFPQPSEAAQQDQFEQDRFLKREDAQKAVDELNTIIDGMANQRLEFGLYDGTGQLFVRVLDRRNNQVIKVMPPEELLQLKSTLRDALGNFMDTRS